ncbi:MAG: organomercurial lyase [Actinomycetota bacterium]
MDDLELRRHVYRTIADTGRAPTAAEIGALVGGPDAAAEHLARLDDRHFVVLDDDGEIAMALPFAANPTGHRVISDDRSWWANCAWDALAIPAAMHADAHIEARWLDDDSPVDLRIERGRPVGDAADALIHFTIPARHWWDDIVET